MRWLHSLTCQQQLCVITGSASSQLTSTSLGVNPCAARAPALPLTSPPSCR